MFHRSKPHPAQAAVQRLHRLARWLVPGASVALAACTLTGDDYEPVRIETQPNQPSDEGPAAPAPSCPGSAQCCEDLPCADGQVCLEGACQPISVLPSGDPGECRGSECPLPEMRVPEEPAATDVSPAATCDDQQRNGDEVFTDCGGGACPGCPDGTVCDTDVDCESGRCSMGSCAAPSCDDGIANGDESSVDCGGSCPNCPSGRACNDPGDCQSAVCRSGGCAPGVASCCQVATCSDGVANANESDVDCGGRCPNCAPGLACDDPGDCQSTVCGRGGCAPGALFCCQAPSCDDGIANGGEPVVDCGNLACGLCALDSLCTQDAQCETGFCQAGVCADPGTCSDSVMNGRETATDCGGSCPRCADRLACNVPEDCVNNNCFEGICISCGSNVIDGTETDIDCGGADPFCRRCDPGRRCLIGSDCASGVCSSGVC